MTDQYPSTDEEQSVHLEVDYPDAATELSRWLPLVKWLLALPHYIVLTLFNYLTFPVLLIAWVAILATGRYPRALFNLMVGYGRWSLRVGAYTTLLVTDRYPPFRLGGVAGSGRAGERESGESPPLSLRDISPRGAGGEGIRSAAVRVGERI